MLFLERLPDPDVLFRQISEEIREANRPTRMLVSVDYPGPWPLPEWFPTELAQLCKAANFDCSIEKRGEEVRNLTIYLSRIVITNRRPLL